MSVYPMKFNYIAHDNQSKSKKKKSDQVSCAARRGEETKSGTEKRCSHNLQSGHPSWWSADNSSTDFTHGKYHASLFFLHIVFVFWY